LSILAPNASPTAFDIPCPKDPVDKEKTVIVTESAEWI